MSESDMQKPLISYQKVSLYGAVRHETLTANMMLKAEASGFGLENCIVKTHIGGRFHISLD